VSVRRVAVAVDNEAVEILAGTARRVKCEPVSGPPGQRHVPVGVGPPLRTMWRPQASRRRWMGQRLTPESLMARRESSAIAPPFAAGPAPNRSGSSACTTALMCACYIAVLRVWGVGSVFLS